MNCVHCGHELPEGATCCPACTAVQPKNQPAAAVSEPVAATAAAAPYSHIAPAAAAGTVINAPAAKSVSSAAPVSAGTTERSSAPISMGGYLGIIILMALPIINIVFALIWSFSEKANINRRNISRAFLLVMGIGLFIAIIALAVLVVMLITNPDFSLSL